MDTSPFHAGEVELQQRAGVHERMAQVGRVFIRDHMPDQHRGFFALLPTLMLGAVDAQGQPWATVLQGEPGFVHSPDPRTLAVGVLPAAADPLSGLITPGRRVGLLGLQPHTRRRNRLNGDVLAVDGAGFSVRVRQSFGNCPKYIHPRLPRPLAQPPGLPRSLGADLDDKARALIAGADTLFIASAAAPGGDADLSHRGGTPGFVSVARTPAGVVLTLADQPGNRMFSTLGNLLLHPLAGLLFVDLAHGHLLQVATRAAVDMRSRTLQLQVLQACWRPHALGLAWVDAAGAAPPA
jgi:predicted pyridoxine 5'-phosphate oxidase superfamily flavin-nucleotide-binding protein